MRIENLRSEKNGDKPRVMATVIWEDCGRPTQDIYFETDQVFEEDLTCNPHAFLVACLIPALHHGEERIIIDAEICPELRDGLETAMGLIRYWYYQEEDRKPVQIEAKARSVSLHPSERAGFFFSGGVDSLATLRANRLNYPLAHPGSIKDGLLVYGLEIDDLDNFEQVVSSLSVVAEDAGVTLIPVYTNIRYLDDDWDFWVDEFEAAVFSAVAHAFTQRLNLIFLASSFDIPNLHPHGSHPLLDPHYSSSDMRIRHDGITFTRLDKMELLADWNVALQHVRVCNRTEYIQPGMLNCGKCEKCVRTMLAFMGLGVLDQTHAFPTQDISEELLWAAIQMNKTTFPFYEELIPPLVKRGREDLTRIIEHYIAVYLDTEPGFKGMAKRFDRKYFYGNLVKYKNLLKKTSRSAIANAKRG